MATSKLKYRLARIKQKFFTHSQETISQYYRSQGVMVGEKCVFCDYLNINEPELVEIGDKVVFSDAVSLITHDHSIFKVTNLGSNLFGRIKIGNDCFIGHGSTILYGVTLADHIIVGSGSVVTSSFNESNIIIAGNPARKIGTWDKLKERYESKAAYRSEYQKIVSGEIDKLVKK